MLLCCGVDVVLDIRPNHIFRSLNDTCALMQKRTLRLTMRKDSYTTHDRLDRICVDDTFLHTWDEECGFAASEVVVQVDKESEERRLTRIARRGIILICICCRINARWWPRAVYVCQMTSI